MIEVQGYNECLSGTVFGYCILAIGEIAFYLQNRQCLSKQRQTVLRCVRDGRIFGRGYINNIVLTSCYKLVTRSAMSQHSQPDT